MKEKMNTRKKRQYLNIFEVDRKFENTEKINI